MANSKQFILDLFPDNNNNEISAADMRIFVNAIFDEEIDIVDIIDNLTSTDQQKPLSANQGRILDDKISSNATNILTKEDSLGTGTEDQVLSIDALGNKVWSTLPTINEVTVYDGLDSTSSTDALSADSGRILDLKTTQNTANISSNTTDISSNTTDIDTINTTTIPALDTRITQNSSDITTNQNNISTNTTNINLNAADITSAENRITVNEGNISTNTSNIGDNTNAISLLDGRVSSNETDITSLQNQVGATDISALETQVSQNTSDITQNGNDITQNASRLDNHDSLISANSTNISTNTGSISANTSSISSNTSSIATNTSSINTINTTTIPALDTRITTNTIEISSLDTRVSQNESDISDLSSKDGAQDILIQNNIDNINANSNQIGNNALDIQSNKDDIEAVQTDITSINTNINNNIVNIENNRLNIVRNGNDIENTDSTVAALTLVVANKEDGLGSPNIDGYVLGSLADGTRVWYPNAYSASDFDVIDNLSQAGDDVNALSANMGYVLDQRILTKESNLQNPARDGSILASNSDGTRFWAEPDILDIDYGNFFGINSVLTSITVNPNPTNIDNSEEDGTAQLTAIATYTLDGGATQDVDVTEQVNWTSSNLSAFTINSGSLGGRITCVNGTATDYNETAIATLDGVQGGTAVNITNTSVLIGIVITPDGTTITHPDTLQMTATGEFSHNGTSQNISNSVTWSSGSESVATIDSSGLVTTVSSGTTQIIAEKVNIKGTTITDSTPLIVN